VERIIAATGMEGGSSSSSSSSSGSSSSSMVDVAAACGCRSTHYIYKGATFAVSAVFARNAPAATTTRTLRQQSL
jgi:hypothetical protein